MNKQREQSFFICSFSFFVAMQRKKTNQKKETRCIKRAFKAFVQKFLSTGLSKFSPNAKKL